MATPKKKTSKSKKRNRKKVWREKVLKFLGQFLQDTIT